MTRIVRLLMMVVLLFATPTVWAGNDSPFELDVKDLDKSPAPAKQAKKPAADKTSRPASKQKFSKKPLVAGTGYTRYTIKNGDHIFKILMKNFGMSNAAAEALIPEILSLNGISDFKRLTIGQTILIPTKNGAIRNEQQAANTQKTIPTEKHGAAESPVSIAVRSITARDAEETLDAILNIIPVKWSKDRTLETTGGARSVPRFSVKVDRYLEYGGQRFIVSLGKADPFTFTLYRLLEMEGYKLISLDAAQTFSDTVSKTLTALKISYRYGDHLVVLNDKNRTATSIKGFLFTKDTVPPRLVLVSEKAVAALTAELKRAQDRPALN